MFIIDTEYIRKIEYVKNNFGIKAQESYIWNELEELKAARDNFKKTVRSLKTPVEERVKLASEMADCYFMGIQIERKELVTSIIINFTHDLFFPNEIEDLWSDVKKEMYFKIDRTIERIKTGYYEK